mmetsp:Transcript_4907/g.9249  ORF Transcript_4907/g.9249 Transcript_4907/m.9249 type:complete len:297 (-) Transcript_4907:484-1374(-)
MAIKRFYLVTFDVRVAAVNHCRLSSTKLKCVCRCHLCKTRFSSYAQNSIKPVFAAALLSNDSKSQRLDESMSGLHTERHVGNFSTNHWLVFKLFPKCFAAFRVLDTFFQALARKAVGLKSNSKAFSDEVAKQTSYVANVVGFGHLDIIEFYKASAAPLCAHAIHLSHRDARHTAFHKDQANSHHTRAFTASTSSHGKVICKHGACNPFFETIDNVKVALFLCCGAQVPYVRSCGCFTHRKRNICVAIQARAQYALAHFVSTIVRNRRRSDTQTSNKSPYDASGGTAAKFIKCDDQK